jgi:hypothetical protein
MNRPIFANEIQNIIVTLGNNKSPGQDGLTAEFYKIFKEQIAKILETLIQSCCALEQLPQSLQYASICLLFKKGDKSSLANWRPISLLNTDYKIIAKLINQRIVISLPKILHEDQKGFVPTRNLDDAILKTMHIMRYCKNNNLPYYLLLLDQEKAFDRVNRDYIMKIFDKLNFPPLIQSLIKSLY